MRVWTGVEMNTKTVYRAWWRHPVSHIWLRVVDSAGAARVFRAREDAIAFGVRYAPETRAGLDIRPESC